jgi:ribonuclease HI
METYARRCRLYVGVSIPDSDSGGWGAILLTDQRRQELSGFAPTSSTDCLGLHAIIAALRATDESSPIRIVTGNQRLHSGLTENLTTWQRNGWQGRNGQPIRHHELWQRVVELAHTRKIESSLRAEPVDAMFIAQAKRLANRAAQLRARRAG